MILAYDITVLFDTLRQVESQDRWVQTGDCDVLAFALDHGICHDPCHEYVRGHGCCSVRFCGSDRDLLP